MHLLHQNTTNASSSQLFMSVSNYGFPGSVRPAWIIPRVGWTSLTGGVRWHAGAAVIGAAVTGLL